MRSSFAGTLLAVTLLATGQQSSANRETRPDLIGTWTVRGGTHEGLGNSTAGKLLVGTVPLKLVISQDGTKLKVEEHRQIIVPFNTREYELNGRPIKGQFVIEPPRDPVPSEATSRWVEDQLVSSIDVLVPKESEPRHYEETLSVSRDGILSVRIQRVGTADSRTMFYKKALQ